MANIDTLENGELVKIVAALQGLQTVMNEDAYNRLQARQKALDKEVSNLYHEIEVSHANVYQAWKYYERLRKLLIERRDVKDSINTYLRLMQSKKPIYDAVDDCINKLSARD